MTQPRNPISWNECFMQMAYLIAMRSKDPSTQAGAVIADENKIIVGLGYNGFPRGIDDGQLPWNRQGNLAETKYAYVVHAEENAIYNANKSVHGCTLYCTLFPCNECTKTIIQNGIKKIYYASDKYHNEEIWVASRKLLDLAGIEYEEYKPEFTLNLG